MDLNLLAESARKKAEVHKKYFKGLTKKDQAKLDERVHELHERVFRKIDCLSCANCCRSLGPMITDKDIDRMAAILKLKPSVVVERYLRIDEDGDYVFQSMPCPFLCNDNYCMIYEHRPKACREYPHTDRRKFYQIHKLTLKNAETCPAVLEILNQLTMGNY